MTTPTLAPKVVDKFALIYRFQADLRNLPEEFRITQDEWNHPFRDPEDLLTDLQRKEIRKLINELFGFVDGLPVLLVHVHSPGNGELRVMVKVSDENRDDAIWRKTEDGITEIIQRTLQHLVIRPVVDEF